MSKGLARKAETDVGQLEGTRMLILGGRRRRDCPASPVCVSPRPYSVRIRLCPHVYRLVA